MIYDFGGLAEIVNLEIEGRNEIINEILIYDFRGPAEIVNVIYLLGVLMITRCPDAS
jgi:hypothetical protein